MENKYIKYKDYISLTDLKHIRVNYLFLYNKRLV